MKKKFLIGALSLASVFAMVSATDEYSENGRRPMFGSEITGYGPCTPTGQTNANHLAECSCEVEVTTYVFWIGIVKKIEKRFTTC